MIRFYILILFSLVLASCGSKSEAPKSTEESQSESKQPAIDPASHVGPTFLIEQVQKRDELKLAIEDFNRTKGDPGVIRYKILTRKGELMSAKRNIRASSRFTEVQKDSLLKPLEEESMSLATDLLAVSK